jgi:SRSO17 transposase
VDPAAWQVELDGLTARIGHRFARREPRLRARTFVEGLLAPLRRKNCWTIAEYTGQVDPQPMQRLLSSAVWDEAGVRADVREYVVERLGKGLDSDQVQLNLDETGDAKKGTHTVGVQRQYSGTCGRIENCQVAVFCTIATPFGHAFIDTRLYMPQTWLDDAARCAAAAVPDEVEFATKGELAIQMLTDAFDAGIAAGWVAGDEVYGASTALRSWLEEHQNGYVLNVACDFSVPTPRGTVRADDLAEQLDPGCWQAVSAGDGSKGPRLYEWAWISLNHGKHHGKNRWLLIRRNPNTAELAYYICYSPRPVSLYKLVRVAGRRWRIEENFQSSKGLCGLDEHQVRTWTSWHRWTTLVMLAHALLAALSAHHRAQHVQQPSPDDPHHELIPLTCNEIQHLHAASKHPDTWHHALRCSTWRRRHQARARRCHYRRRNQDHEVRL